MAFKKEDNLEIKHGFFFLKYIKTLREKNTLKNEVETLRNVIESQLYKTFMEKLEEPAELEKTKSELKRARQKIKILKEMIQENNPSKKSKKRKQEKNMDKLEKDLSSGIELAAIFLIIILIAMVGFAIYEINDFYNDYRCSNLPLNEFFEDTKCEKYWKYR